MYIDPTRLRSYCYVFIPPLLPPLIPMIASAVMGVRLYLLGNGSELEMSENEVYWECSELQDQPQDGGRGESGLGGESFIE